MFWMILLSFPNNSSFAPSSKRSLHYTFSNFASNKIINLLQSERNERKGQINQLPIVFASIIVLKQAKDRTLDEIIRRFFSLAWQLV